MRYPASEKLEIIRLVEQSHLPVKRTLEKLGIPRATFYRWYDLYQSGGPEALDDRSGRTHHQTGPPVPALECGWPAAKRHWRRGTPRKGKPTCANDPKGYGHRIPPPSAPAPAATEQRHAPANPTTKLFSCARTTRTTPTRSPQPFNSSSRRAKPTRPSDRNAPKLPPSLQSENPRTGRGWRYK